MEITVNGVCGQFRKSDRWVLPTFFGPGAPGRTWEKNAPDLRDLFALRIEEARADQAVPYSPHGFFLALPPPPGGAVASVPGRRGRCLAD